MAEMVPINEVFTVRYGNKLDANKLTFADVGINFVSRSSKNLGVIGKVDLVPEQIPNEAGSITVTMGGGYLLSAFVQPEAFYTAQNIKVLIPKLPMGLSEKVFYCRCVVANRHRYSNHGREANRSFDRLLVPARADVPKWAKNVPTPALSLKHDHVTVASTATTPKQVNLIRLDEIFEVKNGINVGAELRSDTKAGPDYLPYIRPSKTQAMSYVEWVDSSGICPLSIFPRHTLYVSTNGQGSHTYSYVSADRFVPNSDVSTLIERRDMSLQEKLYYAAAISSNRALFSYGRKPKGERLKGLLVPDWAPSFIYKENVADGIIK